MPELRLTLLVVGAIFLIGLAWWELRRPHQARGSDLARPTPDPLERPVERTADWVLPRMSARDPEGELPVIEVAAADFAALEARAESAPAPAAEVAVVAEDFAEDLAEELAPDPASGTVPVDPQDFAADVAAMAESFGPQRVTEAPVGPQTGGVDGLLAQLGARQHPDPPISDIHPPPVPPPPAPAEPAMAEAVIVDWPGPEESRVFGVRVVCSAEKFSGRAVRLALAGEGFVIGKFSIFHRPGPDGRALLSVASLNKPGTFDLTTIDMQRYTGVNLFTVLPGPLPGSQAVDELLACAQLLSQRLRGVLQDDQGAPLNPARTAAMRDLAAAAPT